MAKQNKVPRTVAVLNIATAGTHHASRGSLFMVLLATRCMIWLSLTSCDVTTHRGNGTEHRSII